MWQSGQTMSATRAHEGGRQGCSCGRGRYHESSTSVEESGVRRGIAKSEYSSSGQRPRRGKGCCVPPCRLGHAQLPGASFTWASMGMMPSTSTLAQQVASELGLGLGPKWGSGATYPKGEVITVEFPQVPIPHTLNPAAT